MGKKLQICVLKYQHREKAYRRPFSDPRRWPARADAILSPHQTYKHTFIKRILATGENETLFSDLRVNIFPCSIINPLMNTSRGSLVPTFVDAALTCFVCVFLLVSVLCIYLNVFFTVHVIFVACCLFSLTFQQSGILSVALCYRFFQVTVCFFKCRYRFCFVFFLHI